MRKYIIKPISDIIEFYPKLPKPHTIILITTSNYKYDFGKSPHVRLDFDDVFLGDHKFINENHLKTIQQIISNLPDTVIVGCDAGLSRSPAVAAAIAHCTNDKTNTKRILDTYPHLNTDVFNAIIKYVTKKTYT